MPIDYRLYPNNWRALSRQYRSRVKSCQKCEARDCEIHPRKDFLVRLALCHVYDFDPSNLSTWNLAIWCQSCHRVEDNPEQGRRRRYGVNYRRQPDLFDGLQLSICFRSSSCADLASN